MQICLPVIDEKRFRFREYMAVYICKRITCVKTAKDILPVDIRSRSRELNKTDSRD